MASARGVPLGAWETLQRAFRQFRAGAGDCAIPEQCSLVSALPHIFQAGIFVSADTGSIVAGGTTVTTLLTVPSDERWRLRHLYVDRQSGDNDFTTITLVYPAGYTRGPAAGYKLFFSTGVNRTIVQIPSTLWADAPTALDVLLEPGTLVRATPGGVGTVATVFRGYALVLASKVVRDRGFDL